MLLEALVAILIFSAGIIGLMGLQAASIRSTSEAKYRTDAAFLANKVIAQMWVANNATLPTTFQTGGAGYAAWLAELSDPATGLPGTTANPPTIVFSGTNAVSVTVNWQRPGDPLVHKYLTSTQIITNPLVP